MFNQDDHEYRYDPSVEEDDKIVGRILTRRQALALTGMAGLATLVGCGGGGSHSTTTTTGTTGTSGAVTAPAIATQPSGATVSAGGAAAFTVVASGTSPTYQWYKGGAAGSAGAGGVAISGATGATLTLSAVATSDAGNYYVVVANSAGRATSTVVALTIGASIDLVATPQAIEGPFWVDENLLRSDLVTPGASRTTVAGGFPLALTLTLYRYDASTATGTPLSGAHIDVWQADAIGTYSDEASGGIQSESTTGQTWLRGYGVTDARGVVAFRTIHPGWYAGRTPHIHVRIRTYSASGNVTHNLTTQMFFTDAQNAAVLAKSVYAHGTRTVFNANDNVYSVAQADGTTVGSHLMLNVVQGASSETANFALAFVLS